MSFAWYTFTMLKRHSIRLLPNYFTYRNSKTNRDNLHVVLFISLTLVLLNTYYYTPLPSQKFRMSWCLWGQRALIYVSYYAFRGQHKWRSKSTFVLLIVKYYVVYKLKIYFECLCNKLVCFLVMCNKLKAYVYQLVHTTHFWNTFHQVS